MQLRIANLKTQADEYTGVEHRFETSSFGRAKRRAEQTLLAGVVQVSEDAASIRVQRAFTFRRFATLPALDSLSASPDGFGFAFDVLTADSVTANDMATRWGLLESLNLWSISHTR